MEGVGEAKWSTDNGNRRKTYSDREWFLNSLTYLFGSKNADSIRIPVGVHNYEFSCRIPPSVPYTLEAKHGYIRYRVDANLDIPWARDVHTEAAFTVMDRSDLNLSPHLKNPVAVEQVKVFCRFLCDSNPFIMTLLLPKQGYAVGEVIPMHVSLINKSSTKVRSTNLQVERAFIFVADGHRNIMCSIIGEKTCRGVSARQEVTFDEQFMIPKNAYTTIDKYCKVFKVKYRIILYASTCSCSTAELYLPITIGTIGFRNEQPYVQPSAPVERVSPTDIFAFQSTAPISTRGNLDDDFRKIMN